MPFSVAPDGCRDLIWTAPLGERPYWRLSPLDPVLRCHRIPAGTALRGWRLHPGVQVDTARLLAAVDQLPLATRQDGQQGGPIEDLIDTFTRSDPLVTEALEALATSCSVAEAARVSGIGMRRLQRNIVQATGRPPVWWLRLARARCAALALAREAPADVAAGAGYSDQAHLTRDMRAFFATTPSRIHRGDGPFIGRGYGA